MRFNHINVPDQWRNYWTKYPNGYTILEALMDWISHLNTLTDNINTWNDYLDNFVDTFEFELQQEVEKTIKDWQLSGFLDDIIASVLNTGLDELDSKLNTGLDELDSKLSDNLKSITDFKRLDGEIDDSARFQRAFDSGFNIILENNKEYIVNNIKINHSDFKLDGNNSILKTSSPTSILLNIESTCENIKISNTRFLGKATGASDIPTGIRIKESSASATRGTSAKNIEISNCSFLGGFVSAIMANSTTDLKIHDCFFTGNKYVHSASAGGYSILLQTCYDVDIYNNKAIATATDRHAVYSSCNQSLTSSKINENINIYDNIFDWCNVATGVEHEAVIVMRSTLNGIIRNNTTFGGRGGILINPSNGDCTNIMITDNILNGLLGASGHELSGIASIPQDKGGSYKVRNLKIQGNIVNSIGDKVFSYSIYDTIGFDFSDNVGEVTGSSSRGVQLANCENGVVGGNRLNGSGTARSAFAYGTMTNILIKRNIMYGFVNRNEEPYNGFALTNIKYEYERSFLVRSNGTKVFISEDADEVVKTIVSDVNGFKITFNNQVSVFQGMEKIVTYDGNNNLYFYSRTADNISKELVVGMKDNDATTPIPLITKEMILRVFI